MKKALLSLILLAGAAGAANAQGLKLGLKGGFNGSTFSGSDSKGTQYKAGFAAGGLINYAFSDMISVQPEFLYSQKGASQDGAPYTVNGITKTDGTRKTTLGYLDVPILLKVSAGEEGKGLFFEAGPQGSFVISQRAFTENGSGSQEGASVTSTDGLNKVVLGYVAGLGYQITSGLGVGLRYTGDFTQLYKDETTTVTTLPDGSTISTSFKNPNLHNSVFQFQVHYLFSFAK